MYCEHAKMGDCVACKADRIAALEAELARARLECNAVRDELRLECDAREAEKRAHARTQADAAAMRMAIEKWCASDNGFIDVDGFMRDMNMLRAARDTDAGRAIAERVPLLEAVAKAAQRFIERTAEIDDKHPAYGFVVMGIPLAKALAALDDKGGNCIHCGYPENCHQDNPLFHDHAYKDTK